MPTQRLETGCGGATTRPVSGSSSATRTSLTGLETASSKPPARVEPQRLPVVALLHELRLTGRLSFGHCDQPDVGRSRSIAREQQVLPVRGPAEDVGLCGIRRAESFQPVWSSTSQRPSLQPRRCIVRQARRRPPATCRFSERLQQLRRAVSDGHQHHVAASVGFQELREQVSAVRRPRERMDVEVAIPGDPQDPRLRGVEPEDAEVVQNHWSCTSCRQSACCQARTRNTRELL